MEFLANFWTILEFSAFIGVVILFFADPIRGWNFFGFRPTAIIVLADRKHENVLMIRRVGEKHWLFPQGGIFNNDLNATVGDILERELGLPRNTFSLRYTERLGVAFIPELLKKRRITYSSISIMPWLIGKGYLVCFCNTRMGRIKRKISLGHGIAEYKILSIHNARQLLKELPPKEHQRNKRKERMLKRILDEVEERFRKYKQK